MVWLLSLFFMPMRLHFFLKSFYDLDMKLKIIYNLFSSIDVTINIDKTKIMIDDSRKKQYDNFMYEKNNMEEVTSYKYLGIILDRNLN